MSTADESGPRDGEPVGRETTASPSPLKRPEPVEPPTASALAPLTPGDPSRIGPFRLLSRLGGGAMGEVFLAADRAGRPVAVKRVRAEYARDAVFRTRFAKEVAAVRAVTGGHTPALIDADAEAERPWIATAYVPGPSLAQAVDLTGALPEPLVLALGGAIAEALAAIHATGIVHRDMKPSNILLDRDGPKVIDFGISRALDGTALTATGMRVGTAGYTAPELAAHRQTLPAGDVFALGCVLAYAATGVTPFGEGADAQVLYRIVHEPPDPRALACRDTTLRAVIESCLSKDPGARPTPQAVIEACRGTPAPDGSWLPPPLAAQAAAYGDEATRQLARAARRRIFRRVRVGPAPLLIILVAVALAIAVPAAGEIPRHARPGQPRQLVHRSRPGALSNPAHHVGDLDRRGGHQRLLHRRGSAPERRQPLPVLGRQLSHHVRRPGALRRRNPVHGDRALAGSQAGTAGRLQLWLRLPGHDHDRRERPGDQPLPARVRLGDRLLRAPGHRHLRPRIQRLRPVPLGPDGCENTSPAQWIKAWDTARSDIDATAGGLAHFMWAPGADTGGTTIDPAPYWPGASQVDMVGVEGFPDTRWGPQLGTFSGIFGPVFHEIHTLTRLPIFLAETNLAPLDGSGYQSLRGFISDLCSNGGDGVLQFQDDAPPLSATQWTELDKALASDCGHRSSTGASTGTSTGPAKGG